MWTNEHRARQAAFERRRYPTDLTDAEWEQIRPLLPEPAERGRKPGVDLREILNAIRYLARAIGSGAADRLADAAARLPVLADRVLVVPAFRAPAVVPHHSRHRADA
jgi:hypothetical protein